MMKVRQNLYEFDRQDAFGFADFTRSETKVKGNELQFKLCPYCKGGAHRDKNTFSISLKTGQFKCQRGSCGIQGNMLTLANDFNFQLSEEYAKYTNMNNINGKFKKFADAHRITESKPKAIEYMESRGISENTTKRYEITTNADGNLVFPFKNEDGELEFIKYRTLNRKNGKSKEWCESNCKPILFGMNHCNLDEKTLIITEGQIDSLSLSTIGIVNAVSVPLGKDTFSAWIPHVWNWLQNFKRIIVFGDYENGEMSLLRPIQQRIKFAQIWHVRYEDYKDCKDANEILLKHGEMSLRRCIEFAVRVPLQQVIDIADVEDINPFDIPKLPTGIYPIDKLLYGGVPFGGVSIISGKCGDGKSTFADQVILSALKAEHKVFAYSGELPNHLIKSWLMLNAAGPDFCVPEKNAFDENIYRVSDGVKSRINDWFRNKLFLFDNSALNGDSEDIGIINLLKEVIQQYGVDVILIDNLMTAIDLNAEPGSSQYEKQSSFMKSLSRIALEYNVVILLVAHKRKNAFGDNANDEIMGSSDIGNLAMLNMVYEMDRRKNASCSKNQRLLKITKNRLFGRLNEEGIILDFDEASKRIFVNGPKTNLHADYGWNTDTGEFEPIPESILDVIPF